MASFPDITLTKNVWTDVTAAVGAALGADMIVSNVSLGDFPCRVETAVTSPPVGPIRNGVLVSQESATNAQPDVTESVYATSETGNARISVQVL